jgi:Tol biopolymer transport system component
LGHSAGEDESRATRVLRTNLPETVTWTPNGKLVYAIRTGENWDLWTSNSDGSESKQLTADVFIDQQPAVTGDGRYIVYQSNRSGSRNLWRIDIDGTNPKQLTTGNSDDAAPASSPDGKFIVFHQPARANDESGRSVLMVGVLLN